MLKSILVSRREHARAWLMKRRLRVQGLDEVVRRGLDALAEQEGWDDLKPHPEGEADG